MNIKIIYIFNDFQEIINQQLLLSGDSFHIYEEIDHNMWCISVIDTYDRTHLFTQLSQFLTLLLENRLRQVREAPCVDSATFYLWFDEQAGQLRFNIISGSIVNLPFGCQLRIVKNPAEILAQYVSSSSFIGYDELEIVDKKDISDAEWDVDEQEPYVLDVFTCILE